MLHQLQFQHDPGIHTGKSAEVDDGGTTDGWPDPFVGGFDVGPVGALLHGRNLGSAMIRGTTRATYAHPWRVRADGDPTNNRTDVTCG